MSEMIFKWIDKHKCDEGAFINLLKFFYSLSTEFNKVIFDVFISTLLAYFLDKNDYLYFIISCLVLVVGNYFYYLVNSYNNRKNKIEKNVKNIIDEINLITTSLDNYISDDDYNDNGVFEFASDLVSSSMYNILKLILGCDVRVSIVQQFVEDGKQICVMLSRRSKTRQNCKKSLKVVKYEKNKDYYYQKILFDNKDDMIILNGREIDKHFIYKNKDRKSHICQYIGIPDKNSTEKIVFLVQLDAMIEDAFGKTREEIDIFYTNYIYPYMCFLKHAYNIERYLKKKEGY